MNAEYRKIIFLFVIFTIGMNFTNKSITCFTFDSKLIVFAYRNVTSATFMRCARSLSFLLNSSSGTFDGIYRVFEKLFLRFQIAQLNFQCYSRIIPLLIFQEILFVCNGWYYDFPTLGLLSTIRQTHSMSM